MFGVIATSVLAFVILLITEKAAKKNKLSAEVSRKIPHFVASIAVASWPFFVSMDAVAILGLVYTVFALIMRPLNPFPHSRRVERKSWGEVLMGLGIILAALLDPSRWVFATAMLYMGLADAMAALVGSSVGEHRYKVFGHQKTVEGTVAFIVTAAAITAVAVFGVPAGLEQTWLVIIWLPVAAGLLEAALPFGLDNLLLPVFVVLVLNSL